MRNPRRTLSTMVGVTLGVGLFCGVLLFVDGLAASMTQRAVAPLPIDMQRIVTERVGGAVTLTQTFESPGALAAGNQARVDLEVHNTSAVAANEVAVRSLPGAELSFVAGSAELQGAPLPGFADNPLAHGSGMTGFNLGTVEPGGVRRISYLVEARAGTDLSDATISSSYSSRESVSPVAANEPSTVPLDELAQMIAQIDGVAHASQLSLADLGPDTLSAGGSMAGGPAKIFGFDADYARRDDTVNIVEGQLAPGGGVLSAEAAAAMSVGIGDTVTVALPDGSTLDVAVSGIADLTRARSLFSSRRGGDLETFIYSRNSITVSPNEEPGSRAHPCARSTSSSIATSSTQIRRPLCSRRSASAPRSARSQRTRTTCWTTSPTHSPLPPRTPPWPSASSSSSAYRAACSRRCSPRMPGRCSPAPSAGNRPHSGSAAQVDATCSACSPSAPER